MKQSQRQLSQFIKSQIRVSLPSKVCRKLSLWWPWSLAVGQSEPSNARTRCGPIASSKSNVPRCPFPLSWSLHLPWAIEIIAWDWQERLLGQCHQKLPLLWTCQRPPLQNSSLTPVDRLPLYPRSCICRRLSQSFIHPAGFLQFSWNRVEILTSQFQQLSQYHL